MKPLCAALIAAFPLISSAADSVAEAVVVTASRQPVRVAESLADVTVIDRDEIAQAGSSGLAELLGRQAGISFSSNGGPGTASSVFVRGASAAQTLILVDGLRFGSETTGGAALEHLSLEQIERIEIVRGPASALYGADAVGGVIQIFTRQGQGKPALDAFAGAGRYGAESYALGGSGEAGALRFSLRGSYDKTDGFSAIADKSKQAYSYDPDRDGYRRSALGGSLGWKIADGHQLDLSAQYNKGRTHYDAQDGAGLPFDAYADVEVSAFGASLKDRLLDGWDSTLRLGSTLDDSRDFAPWTPLGASFRTRQNQIDWQNDIRSAVGSWVLGASSVRQSALSEGSFDRARTITGIYGGWTLDVGSQHLQADLRRDDNSQFGAHTTGTLAWGWQFVPDWRLRASWGTSFRAPSFNELYYPGYGNEALNPEKGRSGEVALAWSADGSRASLTGYRNRVSNLINSVCDANWVCVAQNVARAELEGLTLAGATGWGGFALEGSADWLRARDPDTGLQLARRAQRQAKLAASYGNERWKLGSEFSAVSGRFEDAANTKRMGGYGLVNLFGQYALSPTVRFEARLDNVFDHRYETAWGYGTAGATLFAGVRISTR
ncbi:TonB-dependent receptor domain-containing protein [Niveibacterium terrae]|uniref:TonB-dependent receptor domain-containing protein n=1 Tax=Niveibacterium terrae TaxID=3373598 RepID=UPI003A947893